MALMESTEKVYRLKATYFERPMISNHGYNFDVVHVVNPYDFTVVIKDDIAAWFEKQLKDVMNTHIEFLNRTMKEDPGKNMKVDPELFYQGMPVLLKVVDKTNSKIVTLVRGEVLTIEGNLLNILLVDLGEKTTKTKEEVLPITVELLRVPRLGYPCRLTQIRPEKGTEWPNDKDYLQDLTGGPNNSSRKIIIMDFSPDTKTYETSVEIDNVCVGLKYFHDAVAAPVPLGIKSGQKGCYPVADFVNWIGLKVIVFGVKVFRDNSHFGKIKCVVQMEPEVVNLIQERIKNYVESASEADKCSPFSKEVGSPCLALYLGEFYRATILDRESDGNYLVEYVDYKERQVVSPSNMLKIPNELLEFTEGATVCQITDFLLTDFQDEEKLKALIENQDLYAVVDSCDEALFGPELLVSLFVPDESFNGPHKAFADVLEIPKRPQEVHEVLQVMEPVPQDLDSIFLTNLIPDSNKIYPGALISVINNWDSIWIQVPETVTKSVMISTEMVSFYSNGGCLDQEREAFLSQRIVGKYVAAKMLDDEGLEEYENFLYRTKVVDEKDGMLHLFYIDYGNSEWVKKNEVYPLHIYFLKDPLMAFEAALKF